MSTIESYIILPTANLPVQHDPPTSSGILTQQPLRKVPNFRVPKLHLWKARKNLVINILQQHRNEKQVQAMNGILSRVVQGWALSLEKTNYREVMSPFDTASVRKMRKALGAGTSAGHTGGVPRARGARRNIRTRKLDVLLGGGDDWCRKWTAGAVEKSSPLAVG